MAGTNPPRRGQAHQGLLLVYTLLLTILSFPSIVDSRLYSQADSQCSLSEEEFINDPAVQTMNFNLGYGPQEFHAYVILP